ncbi:MAG: hypothetical protein PHX08_19690 [Lachnospiraceae bacterium]|nr:hypothetical protein [Lachnospiraceae bacterium]
MKKGNLEKWTNLAECNNLLFFSQLVNELLFDYSIPSNRIATLNSHFLCQDALNAIDGIDNHGVPEGTLKPIVEELYSALKSDPIFSTCDESPLNYFVKYQNESYRISTRVSELNYEELKKCILALHTKFFQGNKYFSALKIRITKIVMNNDSSLQKELFRLVKAMLTELVNLGYDQNYIFYVMDKTFWSTHINIDNPNKIDVFFSYFPMKRRKYTVIFVVNQKKIERFINYIDDLECRDTFERRTTQKSEQKFLRLKNEESYLVIDRDALDPFSAAKKAKNMLTINAAFYRLNDHEYRYNIDTARCGVYSKDTLIRIPRSKSAIAHTKMPSSKQIKESMDASGKAMQSVADRGSFGDYFALISAASFHSQSLDSISQENQLLDLWAIFESVLDISNKHTSDRIQQVCLYIVPILKRKYIYSLFSQLTNDIKNYSELEYYKIIGSCTDEKDAVQKVCEFAILDEFAVDRTKFFEVCADFPLLHERIEYYSTKLKTPVDAFNFVEKHATRVKWQIMRIYRNRNLIIHNGDSMPYLGLLIENMHSYVDDFLRYTIHSLSKGNSVNSMCQELFVQECEWIATFSKKSATMDTHMIEKMLSF